MNKLRLGYAISKQFSRKLRKAGLSQSEMRMAFYKEPYAFLAYCFRCSPLRLKKATAFYIPERRFTEYSFIFPVELGYAFIAHAQGGARSSFAFHQHKALGFMKAQLFLIL